MYIIIERIPTKEDIRQFEMKITEEDSCVDYCIDLSKVSEEDKKALAERYGFEPARVTKTTTIILTHISAV